MAATLRKVFAAAAVWPRWLLLLAPRPGLAQAAASCDRTCLEGFMSQYLTALAAHDPASLPTTSDVLYVENSQVLPLHPKTGEWPIAGSPGKYRHVFSDPHTGEVAAITTITENGVNVIYIVRLKVDDGKITEAETQITRDSAGAAAYEKMGQPEDVWLQAVPEAQRVSRATLITQSNRYYSGMERNDPKGDYSFFDKDCNRLEDAVQTTNLNSSTAYGHSNDTVFSSLTCEAQFKTGFLGFVTLIRERRFPRRRRETGRVRHNHPRSQWHGARAARPLHRQQDPAHPSLLRRAAHPAGGRSLPAEGRQALPH